MKDLITLKQEVFKYTELRLGAQIIDLELDPDHLEIAYERAIGMMRQRSSNAYEEAYRWLALKKGENIYTLPEEVSEVREVFRRSFGMVQGTGSSSFDPFGAGMVNMYLGTMNAGGGMFTYHLAASQLEQAKRMFGGYINFTWNPATKKIILVRNVHGDGEVLLIWCYVARPEVELLTDYQTSQWIKDFTYSASKEIIGTARGKFSQVAGPNGGVSLDGSELKSEAKEEIKELLEDLNNYVDGSDSLTWVQG